MCFRKIYQAMQMLKCNNPFSRKMHTTFYEQKNNPTSPMLKLAKKLFSLQKYINKQPCTELNYLFPVALPLKRLHHFLIAHMTPFQPLRPKGFMPSKWD